MLQHRNMSILLQSLVLNCWQATTILQFLQSLMKTLKRDTFLFEKTIAMHFFHIWIRNRYISWMNEKIASRYVSWRQFEILCHNLDLLKCTYRSMVSSWGKLEETWLSMFTKFSESQDLPRFDRSKKDVTIYTIIYIYRCYVIKYIDVTILKKIYIIVEKSKK